MNICPGCESEMEQGLELCESCLDEKVEEAIEQASVSLDDKNAQEEESTAGASLELEDGQRFTIDREEVLRIANLARLHVDDEEADALARDLESILDHVATLREAPLPEASADEQA